MRRLNPTPSWASLDPESDEDDDLVYSEDDMILFTFRLSGCFLKVAGFGGNRAGAEVARV